MIRKNTRWFLLVLAQSFLFLAVCGFLCWRMGKRIEAVKLSVDAELIVCRESVLAVREIVDGLAGMGSPASLGAGEPSAETVTPSPVYLGSGRGPTYIYRDYRVYSDPSDTTGTIQRVYSFRRRTLADN